MSVQDDEQIVSNSNEDNISFRGPSPSRWNLTVEPIVFVLCFGMALTDSLNTNILLERTCTTIFNRTDEICKNHEYSDIQTDVQTYTANVIMTKTIIESVISSFVSFFIGPWTDKNGRKLFLILPSVGNFIYFSIWLGLSLIPSIPPYYFVIASIPSSLFGGFSMIFCTAFCYIADVTGERNRAYRIALTDLTAALGVVFGYFFTTVLIRLWPSLYLVLIYSVTLLTVFFVIIYSYKCIPETINFNETREEEKKFFTFYHIIETGKSLIVKRPGSGRAILIILILLKASNSMIYAGESTFRFLVFRKVLGWTMDDYNIFSAYLNISTTIGTTLAMIIFFRILKMPEQWIAVLVTSVTLVSAVCGALSNSSLDFYLAANLGVLFTLMAPVTRAEMSKIFASKDAGKVFSFMSALEAGTPFIASVAYTAVYNKVIIDRAQNIYLLSAAILLINLALCIVIVVLNWIHGSPYETLKEEQVENNTNEDQNR